MLRLVCLCMATLPFRAVSGEPIAGEYEVKATFLYNFTKFTEWPDGAFDSAASPIVIGIVGEDPFGTTVDDLIRGEIVHDRRLEVRRLQRGDNLRGCHLLFISHSEREHIPGILKQLKGSPVLTVSEFAGFAEQGGMVNLLVQNKSLKIEINQKAAEQVGIHISAKLLRLARLVETQ